ncbi:MAG: nickel-responsive transcriptional regulator NikR [Gammaproteobacteria bacterium]
MRRLTISVDDQLATQFDELIERKGYLNRSEAFRDLVRSSLEEGRLTTGTARHCIASLSYVYNHHERNLASRLTEEQHEHHDLTVSAMHVHLDHENCMETVILKGPTVEVIKFAESIIAQTGVRHGKLNLIPGEMEKTLMKLHGHRHLRPST